MAKSKSDSEVSADKSNIESEASVNPAGARDPMAEAKRVDELANWRPTAQQSARGDEGRHHRPESAGTFGVSDSPNARDK